MIDTMENAMSKGKPEAVQAPRTSARDAEVRALGQAAAALSLQALRLSRQAAELSRPAKGAR